MNAAMSAHARATPVGDRYTVGRERIWPANGVRRAERDVIALPRADTVNLSVIAA